jgi:peptidoglycan/LPS O-acetylase OafA/YrhL
MTSTAELTRDTSASGEPRAPRPGRIAGVDGLRALAVIAVVVFHLLPGRLDGGFIGVDVFFVISGFLITGLLLGEHARSGGIRLVEFWRRRARRLLPALAAVVLASSSVALLIGGDVLVNLGRQLLGAATFSYNWVDIRSGSMYFDYSSPELFRNLWSLAVEEQFYLVWPLVVLAVVLVRRRRARFAVALGVAGASAAAMIVLSLAGADGTRVYYGTDTHSFGLALGAALAILLEARPAATWSLRSRRATDAAGLLALAALVLIAAFMPPDAPIVYRGALALVAVLTAMTLAALAIPGSFLGRVLDVAPLRWIGQRSYGIYLWHWPVYVLALAWIPQFDFDRNGQLVLGALTASISLAAAALSYRYLESPVRRLGFRAAIRRVTDAARRGGSARVAVIAASVTVFSLVAATGFAVLTGPSESAAQARVEAGVHAIAAGPDGSSGTTGLSGTADADGIGVIEDTAAAGDPAVAGTEAAPPDETPAASPTPSWPPSGDQITAIGDSVMLASAPWLQKAFPGIDIHASVARQASAGPRIVEKLRDRGELRPVLIVGLGTNGRVDRDDLEAIRSAAGPATRLVLVDVQAPRKWTKGVNAALARFAAAHDDVEVADWRSKIRKHLELLPDKIHPGGAKGGRIYVAAISEALERLAPAVPAAG